VRGLVTEPYDGKAEIGVVFHCENGYLVSARYDDVSAFDLDGNLVKQFKGGRSHFQTFLDAIKDGGPGAVTADATDGHVSSGMCHLANISHLLGERRPLGEVEAPFGDEMIDDSISRMREHLAANGVDPSTTEVSVGPSLAFDPGSERFTGSRADEANALIRREGRGPYRFPDLG